MQDAHTKENKGTNERARASHTGGVDVGGGHPRRHGLTLEGAARALQEVSGVQCGGVG